MNIAVEREVGRSVIEVARAVWLKSSLGSSLLAPISWLLLLLLNGLLLSRCFTAVDDAVVEGRRRLLSGDSRRASSANQIGSFIRWR